MRDAATAGAEVCAPDWEDLILGGADDAYLAEADGLCASGDFLACKSYDESGNEFYAIADLTDGSVAPYYADELPGEDALLTPYRDGELLCITREWGSGSGNISRICRFDPASGATDELCALATGEGYLEAPAYRAENDTLYYPLGRPDLGAAGLGRLPERGRPAFRSIRRADKPPSPPAASTPPPTFSPSCAAIPTPRSVPPCALPCFPATRKTWKTPPTPSARSAAMWK